MLYILFFKSKCTRPAASRHWCRPLNQQSHRAEAQKSYFAKQNSFFFLYFQQDLRVFLCFRPWKFEHMATDLLYLQLREDHPLPPDAVLYFTQSLIHDSISIRKVCSFVSVWLCSHGRFIASDIPPGRKDLDGLSIFVVDHMWHAVHLTPHPVDSPKRKSFNSAQTLRLCDDSDVDLCVSVNTDAVSQFCPECTLHTNLYTMPLFAVSVEAPNISFPRCVKPS